MAHLMACWLVLQHIYTKALSKFCLQWKFEVLGKNLLLRTHGRKYSIINQIINSPGKLLLRSDGHSKMKLDCVCTGRTPTGKEFPGTTTNRGCYCGYELKIKAENQD